MKKMKKNLEKDTYEVTKGDAYEDTFNPEEINTDYYFWLGKDGELKAMEDEEAFQDAVEAERFRTLQWLNVDVSTI